METKGFWQTILELNQAHGLPWVFERHIEWAKKHSSETSAEGLWKFAKQKLVEKKGV